METEKQYYEKYKTGKIKTYIHNVHDFKVALKEYLPSQIRLDTFSEDYPYIEGSYRDRSFSGAYVKQCGLTFRLDSLSDLEGVFKFGMFVYV